MFAQSKPCAGMIELVHNLKAKYGLKIIVVSNESRGLNAHRISKFKLALDIAQTPARQIVYIENTPIFVQIAEGLGIRSILHTDYKSTCAKLAAFGLQNDVIHETR